MSTPTREQVDDAMGAVLVDLCDRCEHPASWHRVDDADGGVLPGTLDAQEGRPLAKFRCIGYDCMEGGSRPPKHRCTCPDYVATR